MKKVLWIITAGITVVAGGYALLWATAPAKTTHQSHIQVGLLDAAGTPERKMAEYERIVQMVDAWADRSGFARVPREQAGSLRQAGAAASPSDTAAYYRETQPQDPAWPIEAVVTFNPDLAPVVNIAMSEGYHRGPSPRLQKLHFALWEQLRERYGSKITVAMVR